MADVRETSGVQRGTVGSSARSQFPRIPLKLENSFRTEPGSNIPRSSLVNIIKETFESMLTNKEYSQEECPKLARLLSDMIKDQAKALGVPRYKIISVVTIGPADQSTLTYASRFIWNHSFDTYAEHSFKNSKLYAVGTVFAVYVD